MVKFSDIPSNKEFYVINGDWYGYRFNKDGRKYIRVYETGRIFEVTDRWNLNMIVEVRKSYLDRYVKTRIKDFDIDLEEISNGWKMNADGQEIYITDCHHNGCVYLKTWIKAFDVYLVTNEFNVGLIETELEKFVKIIHEINKK